MYIYADGGHFSGSHHRPDEFSVRPRQIVGGPNWHAPDKVKGVRQFVGFVGYYRRFVKDFADLVEPLVALTRKGAPFVWTH